MSELILHHYPSSPFAEKVRAILGYKQLPWRSVHIPQIMPKPDLLALTGGYRKTPVLQIGADIYCDTALIADVLEGLQPQPSLYPPEVSGLARMLAQWADTTLFWAAMGHNFAPAGAAQMFGKQAPEVGKAFADDRAKMRVAVPRLPPPDATVAYRSYLRRLSSTLGDKPFLLGEQPTIADFACYHPVWFTQNVTSAMAGILNDHPTVLAWLGRMAQRGATKGERMGSEEAIEVAAQASPAALTDTHFQDDHGIALGSWVSIKGEAFGPEPTEGQLVAATRTRYTLTRTDERAGTVHVHLPRVGYILKAVQ